MTVKIQRKIKWINDCNCKVDEFLLTEASLWKSKKPMTSKQSNCSFCRRNISIMSSEYDELWYLDPTDSYGKNMQQQNHENVQVDINDSKYPDARPGDSSNAGFWFNYCPMCGRKLVEAQHDTRTA